MNVHLRYIIGVKITPRVSCFIMIKSSSSVIPFSKIIPLQATVLSILVYYIHYYISVSASIVSFEIVQYQTSLLQADSLKHPIPHFASPSIPLLLLLIFQKINNLRIFKRNLTGKFMSEYGRGVGISAPSLFK